MIRTCLEMMKYRGRVIIFFWGSLVGSLLAGHEIGMQPLFPTVTGPLTMYLVGLFAYIYNDIRDIDADRINASNRPIPSGKVSKWEATKLVIALAVLAIVLSLLLNPFVFATALFGIFLGLIYSTPPLSLKNRPLSKWIVTSLWCGVASMGGSLAVSQIITGKTLYAVALFIVQGLACSPVADLLDIAGDRAAGKRTIAVVLGSDLTAKMSTVLLGSTCIITVFIFNLLGFNWLFPILLGASYMMFIWWTLLLTKRLDDKTYRASILKKAPLASMAMNLSLIIGTL